MLPQFALSIFPLLAPCLVIFFQAEDGIRDFCLSRGLGDVYKRQIVCNKMSSSITHVTK